MAPCQIHCERRQAKLTAIVNDGLADFQQKLRLDPQDGSAMLQMSDLIRDAAALRDTKAEYASDIAVAEAWKNRGFDAQEAKARGALVGSPPQQSLPATSPASIRASESAQMPN